MLGFAMSSHTQTSSWTQLCKLDQKMIHSSGILTLNEGETFWTQVDNSSPEEIYEIDKNCNLLRTLRVTNVTKTKVFIKNANSIDWEDITHDDIGNIYIGDFGNNNNNRTNLKIYILKNVSQSHSDTIPADVIKFKYANQKEFPPPSSEQNFDLEAMIWYNDSLHLFSKNRTNPFTGYTYQYSMPAIPGEYELWPVDSFKTGDGPMVFFWITGAALNQNDKQLMLLSHDRIWIFSDFESSMFFQGKSKMITLPTYSQKEGVCYAKENTWYLTDEYFSTLGIGGNLYEMKLESTLKVGDQDEIEFTIEPNPVHEILQLVFPEGKQPDSIRIYNMMGKLCKEYTINKLKNLIPVQDLINGIYIVRGFSKKLNTNLSKLIIIQK
jgi:hypothetical protein